MDRVKGYTLVFLSAICFSLMVISAKYLMSSSNISAFEVILFRFILGFSILLAIKVIYKKSIRPVNSKTVIYRAISNTLAVTVFFVVIELISVSKANVYNMTYPIFVAIFAHYTLKERLTVRGVFAVIIGFVGVLFVSDLSSFASSKLSDVVGILSGITAGIAITSLKAARNYDKSFTILFYLMLFGLVLLLLLSPFYWVTPGSNELLFLFLIAVLSLGGQYFLTAGYKYVTSLEGAIVSSSRILFVTILGIILFQEELELSFYIGSVLVLSSIIILNSKLVISKISSRLTTKPNNN